MCVCVCACRGAWIHISISLLPAFPFCHRDRNNVGNSSGYAYSLLTARKKRHHISKIRAKKNLLTKYNQKLRKDKSRARELYNAECIDMLG